MSLVVSSLIFNIFFSFTILWNLRRSVKLLNKLGGAWGIEGEEFKLNNTEKWFEFKSRIFVR